MKELTNLSKAKLNGQLLVKEIIHQSYDRSIRYYNAQDTQNFTDKCLKQIDQNKIVNNQQLQQIFKKEMDSVTELLPQFLQQDFDYMECDEGEYYIISSALLPNMHTHQTPMLERMVKGIFSQLIEAFFELHYLQIDHFPITFNHIGYQEGKLQLQGFGFEAHYSFRTSEYKDEDIFLSPEFQGKKFNNQQLSTREQDMFNLGAIVQTLLIGTTQNKRLLENMTPDLKDLIQKMTLPHTFRRLKWEDLLDHSYFSSMQTEPTQRNRLFTKYSFDEMKAFYKNGLKPTIKNSNSQFMSSISQNPYIIQGEQTTKGNSKVQYSTPYETQGEQTMKGPNQSQDNNGYLLNPSQQMMEIQNSHEVCGVNVKELGPLAEQSFIQNVAQNLLKDNHADYLNQIKYQPVELNPQQNYISLPPQMLDNLKMNNFSNNAVKIIDKSDECLIELYNADIPSHDQQADKKMELINQPFENQLNIQQIPFSNIATQSVKMEIEEYEIPNINIIKSNNQLSTIADSNINISKSRQEYIENLKKTNQLTQYYMNERNKYTLILNSCLFMYQQPKEFCSKKDCFQHIITYTLLLNSLQLNYDILKQLDSFPFNNSQYISQEFFDYYKSTIEYENICKLLYDDAVIIETWFLAGLYDLKEFEQLHLTQLNMTSKAYLKISEELFKFLSKDQLKVLKQIFEVQQLSNQKGEINPKWKLSQENYQTIIKLRKGFEINIQQNIVLSLLQLQINQITQSLKFKKENLTKQDIQAYQIIYLLYYIKAYYDKHYTPQRFRNIKADDNSSFDYGLLFDQIIKLDNYIELQQHISELESICQQKK